MSINTIGRTPRPRPTRLTADRSPGPAPANGETSDTQLCGVVTNPGGPLQLSLFTSAELITILRDPNTADATYSAALDETDARLEWLADSFD